MLLRTYRMTKKIDFKNVFAHGKSYTSKHVVVYIFRATTKRFGFIASKKVGNSVKRNRAKRLLREVVRLHLDKISGEYLMILIARNAINSTTYREVEKSLLYVWKKAGIFDETH